MGFGEAYRVVNVLDIEVFISDSDTPRMPHIRLEIGSGVVRLQTESPMSDLRIHP